MKQKTSLQPKVKTKIKISNTLLYGGGAFLASAAVFAVGFFYMNLGDNESALAAGTVIENKSFSDGNWSKVETWNTNHTPVNGQTVTIKAGHTVTIKDKINFSGTLEVYGTLDLEEGSLSMDEGSKINFHLGSHLTFNEKKSNISIEKVKWNAQKLSEISIPNTLTTQGAMGPGIAQVKLVGFNGDLNNNNQVVLKWQTAMEKGKNTFFLERSKDNHFFKTISELAGEEDSERIIDYNFTDTSPHDGTNYYRLKQTNERHAYEYLKTVKVNVAETKFDILSIDTSEGKNKFLISFISKEGKVNLKLLSRKGQLAFEDSISANRGLNKYELKELSLPHGMYTLYLNAQGDTTEQKRYIFITSQ